MLRLLRTLLARKILSAIPSSVLHVSDETDIKESCKHLPWPNTFPAEWRLLAGSSGSSSSAKKQIKVEPEKSVRVKREAKEKKPAFDEDDEGGTNSELDAEGSTDEDCTRHVRKAEDDESGPYFGRGVTKGRKGKGRTDPTKAKAAKRKRQHKGNNGDSSELTDIGEDIGSTGYGRSRKHGRRSSGSVVFA